MTLANPVRPGFTPISEMEEALLDALLSVEDCLTRTAQDERDIKALHKARAAIAGQVQPMGVTS